MTHSLVCEGLVRAFLVGEQKIAKCVLKAQGKKRRRMEREEPCHHLNCRKAHEPFLEAGDAATGWLSTGLAPTSFGPAPPPPPPPPPPLTASLCISSQAVAYMYPEAPSKTDMGLMFVALAAGSFVVSLCLVFLGIPLQAQHWALAGTEGGPEGRCAPVCGTEPPNTRQSPD